jgi:hypothetical protein
VGEGHGIVGKESPILVAFDEVNEEIAINIGAVFALKTLPDSAILIDEGIVVARAFVPSEDTVLFESHLGDVVGVGFLQDHLPLAGQGGGVAGILQDMPEGNFLRRDVSPLLVVSKPVSAGHNLYPRRRADR